jgi:NTE family protein
VKPADEGHATKVGLVLGAGGAPGAAFSAGTLLALEHDLGWDPRTADIIVGTSAGSIVGMLLRAGFSTDDVAAWGSSVAALPPGQAGRRVLDAMERTGTPLGRSGPRWSMPNPRLFVSATRGKTPFHTALLSILPDGLLDGATSLRSLESLAPDGWPLEPLWIAAVRKSDGRRVVFGKDVMARVGAAVAASCAIPGLFQPVRIGGDVYIDGGAHSPTNADLLAATGVDLAIVVSPMSGQPDALGRRPDHLIRSRYSARLRHECRQLIEAGISVHVFEPDAATVTVLGVNGLDRRRTRSVVRQAFLSAGARIAAADNAPLRTLGRRRSLAG